MKSLTVAVRMRENAIEDSVKIACKLPREDFVPEEPEVENAEVREEEEAEREGRTLLKAIALTTALFAALAAVAALRAGGTVNEALMLKTEATQLQSEASDQ